MSGLKQCCNCSTLMSIKCTMKSSKKIYWLLQLTGWSLFAIINILFALYDRGRHLYFYKRLMIFLCIGLLLSHIIRTVLKEFSVLQKKPRNRWFSFFYITCAVSLLAAYLNVLLLSIFGFMNEEEQSLLARSAYHFWWNKMILVLNNFISFTVIFFTWIMIYYWYHTAGRRKKIIAG